MTRAEAPGASGRRRRRSASAGRARAHSRSRRPAAVRREFAFASRQADEDAAGVELDRADVVIAAVDREPPAQLMHRHVRTTLDEAAQLRGRARRASLGAILAGLSVRPGCPLCPVGPRWGPDPCWPPGRSGRSAGRARHRCGRRSSAGPGPPCAEAIERCRAVIGRRRPVGGGRRRLRRQLDAWGRRGAGGTGAFGTVRSGEGEGEAVGAGGDGACSSAATGGGATWPGPPSVARFGRGPAGVPRTRAAVVSALVMVRAAVAPAHRPAWPGGRPRPGWRRGSGAVGGGHRYSDRWRLDRARSVGR